MKKRVKNFNYMYFKKNLITVRFFIYQIVLKIVCMVIKINNIKNI